MKSFFSAMLVFVVAVFVCGCHSFPGSGQGKLMKYDSPAREILAEMTLDEKIGQMIQAETTGLKDISDIKDYHLGSILAGGSADPKAGNSPEAWADEFERVMAYSMATRLKIPLLFGIDAVHGHSNIKGAVIFPHNIGLGCTANPELAEEIGRVTALEMRATGIHWTFAPCITVPRDERWGRTYEGFSEDPDIVSVLGVGAVKGLQGESLSDSTSVLACIKHYVGDGGTAMGTSANTKILDQGDTQCDEQELRAVHLKPYGPSIKAGAASIMPSYSSWNGVKCSASKYLLTDVLKGELGFNGFLISDYNAIRQIDPDFKKSIGISINAGMDMAMEPTNYREFFKNLKELVEEGTVPMSRIDDAVVRILRVKLAMGMMEPGYNYKADRDNMEIIGCQEHREVARQAVKESLVLLKNNNGVLPLPKKTGRIHVVGSGADDIGQQCGGWTIDWQGKCGNTTEGTTILAGIEQAVDSNTKVTYSADGSNCDGADFGVVVIGEKPYAEGDGDNVELKLSDSDLDIVRKMNSANVPFVVVLLSGRPVLINDVLSESDAFVAAWLPGTEGQGVADVLFGDYSPTGKLSFTWPRDVSQLPINIGDGKKDALFECGFGLSY